MKIKSIKLEGFRCHSLITIDFGDNTNIIFGPNASGKTSIIEAVYIFGLLKSPRGIADRELINNVNDHFYIEASFVSSTLNKYNVSVGFNGEQKIVRKNKSIVKRMSDHIGIIDCVWFSANDLFLLSGSPQNRRTNFDRILCQISKVYFSALSNYKKFLKERNALLKRLIFENRKENIILLETINERLIFEGKRIINIRQKVIEKINEILLKKHSEIGYKNEALKIEYVPSVTEDMIEEKIISNVDEDIKHGNTSFGPHKDDYIFIINNKNIVYQGSQGQQRNAVLSLKLAEVELIYNVKKEYPILLLDDVFNELDLERQNRLLKGIEENVQTIITTTSISGLDKEIIRNSNLIELKGED